MVDESRLAERLAVVERRSDDHAQRDAETRRDVTELRSAVAELTVEFKVFEARVVTFAFVGSLVGGSLVNLAFWFIEHYVR